MTRISSGKSISLKDSNSLSREKAILLVIIFHTMNNNRIKAVIPENILKTKDENRAFTLGGISNEDTSEYIVIKPLKTSALRKSADKLRCMNRLKKISILVEKGKLFIMIVP